jgi:hypothetical protein
MLKRIALTGLFVVAAALMAAKPVAAGSGAGVTASAQVVQPIVGQGICPFGIKC